MCRGVDIHMLLFLSIFFSSVSACSYTIEGLNTLIKIPSTVDKGANVYDLTILKKKPERRKRAFGPYDSKEHDIVMLANSSYFGLMFVDDHHEVIVTSCLVEGTLEPLYFGLSETVDTDNECGTWSLITSVEPAIPVFTIPSAVNVSECMPGTKVDIVQLQFENGGSCSSWNCSANCTNDEKFFWIRDRDLRTSSNDVTFNFVYKIMVTCLDNEAPQKIISQEMNTTGDVVIDVMFLESAMCTSTSYQSTMPVSTAIKSFQQLSPGCLDNTKIVALASSLSGLLLGLVAGIAIYFASRRCCRPVRVNSVL